MDLTPMTADSNRYAMSFKVFCGACDDRRPPKVKQRLSVFSETVVPKLPTLHGEGNQLRILGVGTGSGKEECGMLEKFLSRFPCINLRVVEPDEKYTAQFKHLVESRSHQLRGVSFDWRHQTLEQYQTTGDATKFHFICALHVMYHVDDWESALLYLYNRLEPGGMMRVDITGSGGVIQFWNRFASSWRGCNYISSTEIRALLDQHGISYEVHSQPTMINITKCFDETSEEGSLLLDFLCAVKMFRDTAPKELKEEVLNYLANCESTEKIGSDIMLKNDDDTIIISKSLD